MDFLGSDFTVYGLPLASPVNLSAVGAKVSGTAGESLTFGQAVYFKSDGKAWLADANGTGTYPADALALGTYSANDTGQFLLLGFARNDSWSWTAGSLLYLSTTAGGLTHTQPSATDEVIQVLGRAITTATILFRPSIDWMTHT